jgi:hypothetical protein
MKKLQTNPVPGVTIGPVGDDLMNWVGTIQGPPGSFYEGGVFKVGIRIPRSIRLRHRFRESLRPSTIRVSTPRVSSA